ncbi:MAG TPA: hypothetical protein VM243_15015 [Phycisphaerae bacterium]|nr:hypothetical protein [Phycisphaerae bacterium]
MDEGLKRKLIVGFAVVAIGVCLYMVVRSFGRDEVTKRANTVTLMCSETGELFDVELGEDTAPFPHKNPKTGKMTLYPTEVCWRGECLKRGGTRVILNSWLGIEGPTRCPVCGSGVRAHNPGPPRSSEDQEE